MSEANVTYYDSCAMVYHKQMQNGAKEVCAARSQDFQEDTSIIGYDFFSHAMRTPPGDLLDVGIGTGGASQLFFNAGHNIHGIDSSPNMIELAVKRGFIANLMTTANLNITPLPYETGQFPIVISGYTVQYLSNAINVISEMLRVAQRGGLVMFDMETHKEKEQVQYSKNCDDTGLTSYFENYTQVKKKGFGRLVRSYSILRSDRRDQFVNGGFITTQNRVLALIKK